MERSWGALGVLLSALGAHFGRPKLGKAGKSWLHNLIFLNLWPVLDFGTGFGPPEGHFGPSRVHSGSIFDLSLDNFLSIFDPSFGQLSEGILHEVCPTCVPSLSKVAHLRLLHVVSVHIWSCARPSSLAACGFSLQLV